MSCYKTSYMVQFVSRKAAVCGWHSRVKPKLGDAPLAFHVNMGWLTLIRAEEDKTIGTILKHSGHSV
jgi:hypothetical protein